MMEVVFGSSAAGGVKSAQSFLSKLGSGPADVFCFALHLSVGELSGDCLSQQRQENLLHLYRGFPQDAPYIVKNMEQARQNLAQLLERARQGEPLRIWYSEAPDEYCGMCWLVHTLRSSLDTLPQLRLMTLPNQLREGGMIREYQGWGEVTMQEYAPLLRCEVTADKIFITKAFFEWQAAQEENMPLRAFVNGRLHGVPEDFYDSFIRTEVSRLEGPFHEAVLIGNVMGRYQLKIGDLWLAARIEEMIARGELLVLTEAPAGKPPYRRMLQKKS